MESNAQSSQVSPSLCKQGYLQLKPKSTEDSIMLSVRSQTLSSGVEVELSLVLGASVPCDFKQLVEAIIEFAV